MSTIQMLPRVLPNLGEKALGLTKEFWGTVLDRDNLREEGQAQQKKAEERLEAFRRELKADMERGRAAASEQKQRAYQGRSDAGGTGKSELEKGGAHSAASATAEKLKGGVKQAAGSVLGNDSMRKEGLAQQDKANAEGRVAGEEAKAEKARAKASVAETEEQAARRA